MAGADTAKLLASLDLKDLMSAKLRTAMGNVSAAERGIGSLGTRLSGFASNLKGNVGSALSTFGGRVRQVGLGLTAALGVGGLLSFGGAIKEAHSRATTFGDEVVRLQRVTGLTAETTSALAGVFEHFGVQSDAATRAIGLLEKNVGNLTTTQKKAEAFQKTYGLSLVDANGKVKDANQLLLDTADFYNNKSIPAQTKAAALQKLYGRGWQELLPVLAAGKGGIAAVETELQKMGLTLTTDNLKALRENKEATRNWNSALAGLELQIGLNLLPTFTDLAKSVTAFVTSNRTDIVNFFKNAAGAARSAAGTVAELVGKISGFWNSIPEGFRDLLVKGIVADRTVKFLFGFSPIGSLAGAIEGGFAKAVGSGLAQAGLGKLFVQPVFVTNPGFGGLPGGAGAGAAGGLGLVGGGLALAGVAAALVAGAEVLRQQLHPTTSGDFVQQFTAAEARAYHLGQKTVEEIMGDRQESRRIALNTAALADKRWQITNNIRLNVPVTTRTRVYRYSTTMYASTDGAATSGYGAVGGTKL